MTCFELYNLRNVSIPENVLKGSVKCIRIGRISRSPDAVD
jgi:hypothetical protein